MSHFIRLSTFPGGGDKEMSKQLFYPVKNMISQGGRGRDSTNLLNLVIDP